MKTKLNAFTILEMVVTILLTLILFSLLYLSYNLIQRQLDQGSQDLSDMLRTKLCLDIQMENAQVVSAEEQRVEFYNPLRTSYMLFENGFILLEQENNLDTIYKGAFDYRIYVNPELGLVDQVGLEFMTGRDTVIICSAKKYLPAIRLKKKEVDFEY